MKRKCSDCAIQKQFDGQCPVFQRQISNEDSGCPLHTYELIHCDICGEPTTNVIFDEGHLICSKCFNQPLCHTCVCQTNCLFAQDKTCKEPPYIIVQEHSQPHMTIQKQVINPKRIKETCGKGCPCYYEAGLADGTHCIKQSPRGGCKQYKTLWRN